MKQTLSNIWNLFTSSKAEVPVASLIARVQQIREQGAILVLTGKPYGQNWRGVYNSTVHLFPGTVVMLPHRYSQNILSQKDLALLADAIAQAGFKKIVFSGFSDMIKVLLLEISRRTAGKSECRFFMIYHGFLSQHAEGARDSRYLREIVELHKQGILYRIGFIKKGLSETMDKLAGIESHHLINIFDQNQEVSDTELKGLHAGVFAGDSFRKNVDNQVAAALLLPHSIVHVLGNKKYECFSNEDRIVTHSFLESHDGFLKLLGSMSINFYVTFSECYGMVIAESLSLGVPCMASNSSGFFDYDEFLAKALVVEEYDNSEAIYRKATEVLANRSEISLRGKEYVKKLNAIAREKLGHFLNS